jgi:hypothetical protein
MELTTANALFVTLDIQFFLKGIQMIRYTVRVELHDASREQYTKLHEKMFQQGFTNSATEKDSDLMLPAEYNYDGIVTKKQVLQKAKTIAASIVNKYAVLVTKPNGRTWYG